MLKFPPSGVGNPTDLSYTNSCISEYLGSSIFNMLGIPAQQTLLGVFTVNGKEKVVSACGDFTADGKTLYDFCSIKNTVIDFEHGGSGTELSDILESIEKQQFVNPAGLLEHFWNVFVVDALLGNFNRHNGNWGFLYNSQTDTAEIAPIFDCGNCLLSKADEKVLRNVLTNEDELNARIYRFPTSAIKMDGQKVNYYDFLMSGEYADCNEAIVRIVPKIDMEQIEQFIDETTYISDLQKDFYKAYINARYEKIMLSYLLALYNEDHSALIYGQTNNSGYPVSEILKAIAYVIAHETELFGRRPKGGYIELIERHLADNADLMVEIRRPDLLTPLVIVGNGRGALIGPLNPNVYSRLVTRDPNNEYKLLVRRITEEDLSNATQTQ